MTEKEYIERETLIEFCKKIMNKCAAPVSWANAYADFIDDIEKQPSADVVEVVRCCDCKFRKTKDCAMYYECDCGQQYSWETDNDFCSFGKRRDYNGRKG